MNTHAMRAMRILPSFSGLLKKIILYAQTVDQKTLRRSYLRSVVPVHPIQDLLPADRFRASAVAEAAEGLHSARPCV